MNTSLGSKILVIFAVLIIFTSVFASSTADWSSPENLSDWQLRVTRSWLVLGADGTQAAFWRKIDSVLARESIWARVRLPGDDWGTAQNIFGWIDALNFVPEFEIAPDGTIWALWAMQDPGKPPDVDNMLVKAASCNKCESWDIETLSDHESYINNIDLSLGSEGHLAATWVACASPSWENEGPCDVRVRRRDPGASAWEVRDESVDLTVEGIVDGRSLVGPGGMIVSIWGETSPTITGKLHVKANAYDPTSKNWQLLPTDISQGAIWPEPWGFFAPSIMGSDGTVIVSWYQLDPADQDDAGLYCTTRQSSTGTWSLSTPVSNILDSDRLVTPFQLSVDQDGTAVVAWVQNDGLGKVAAFANVRDPGDTWDTTPVVQVSDWSGHIDLATPQVQADGSIVLLWGALYTNRDPIMDESMNWSARSSKGTWGDLGQGQVGGWYAGIRGIDLAAADDGTISALWGVQDYTHPETQRGKILAATWIPGQGPISVDTLSSDVLSVEVGQESLVVSGDGQTRAAAWLRDKVVENSTTDPDEAVFYSRVHPDNTPPTAAFTVDRETGTVGDSFQFNAAGCTDIEDSSSVLEVHWDWQDDGTYDTSWSTIKTAVHQFSTASMYTVRLQVRDTGGMTNSTTKQITVATNGTTWSKYLYLPMTVR